MQVASMQAVLANGTLATFSPDLNPHLWKAMQVCTAGRHSHTYVQIALTILWLGRVV